MTRYSYMVLVVAAIPFLFVLLSNSSIYRCSETTVIREIVSNSEIQGSGQYLQKVFDTLDYQMKDGSGYKDYLNPDGFPTGALLAWSESYLMQAYAEMFRATGEERYLHKLWVILMRYYITGTTLEDR